MGLRRDWEKWNLVDTVTKASLCFVGGFCFSSILYGPSFCNFAKSRIQREIDKARDYLTFRAYVKWLQT